MLSDAEHKKHLSKISNLARYFLQTARAKSTTDLYLTACRSYIKFCHSIGLGKFFPLEERKLILWATFLSKSVDVSTIKKYIVGVHAFHKDLGFEECTKKFYFLDKALKGIARFQRVSRKSKSVTRLPLTSEILKNMMKFVSDFRDKDTIMLWGAFLLIKFGLLRAGEVLPTSYNPKKIYFGQI